MKKKPLYYDTLVAKAKRWYDGGYSRAYASAKLFGDWLGDCSLDDMREVLDSMYGKKTA